MTSKTGLPLTIHSSIMLIQSTVNVRKPDVSGFQTVGTKPNVWIQNIQFGLNCLKSELFCLFRSQLSEIRTFLFSLVPTVGNRNVGFGPNCLKSELFHSVSSQLSEIGTFSLVPIIDYGTDNCNWIVIWTSMDFRLLSSIPFLALVLWSQHIEIQTG